MKKRTSELTNKEIVRIKYSEYKSFATSYKKAGNGNYDAETKTIEVQKRVFNLIKINVRTSRKEERFEDIEVKVSVNNSEYENNMEVFALDEEYSTGYIFNQIYKALKADEEVEVIEENVELTQEEIDLNSHPDVKRTVQKVYFEI